VRPNVDALKQRFRRDIVVHGSPRVVQQLLELDLVDELRLMVFPIVLGSGKRLFAASNDVKRFGLAATTTMGDGIVLLTYTRVL
jgi:dihydrofolate reductase